MELINYRKRIVLARMYVGKFLGVVTGRMTLKAEKNYKAV